MHIVQYAYNTRCRIASLRRAARATSSPYPVPWVRACLSPPRRLFPRVDIHHRSRMQLYAFGCCDSITPDGLLLSALLFQEKNLFSHCASLANIAQVSHQNHLAVSRTVMNLALPRVSPNIASCGERTDRIVFHHTQWAMSARSHKRAIVARHGHRDKAHHDGAGFR
jgi:hypothetical protein